MDKRIVKYNVDFCFRNFQYDVGAVRIDLFNIDDMHGHIIAEWNVDYAKKHLLRVLSTATGIKGGWNMDNVTVEISKHNKDVKIYDFTISSRLYKNLRRIYERK